MGRRLRWAVAAIVGAVLGFYMALNATGWPSWLVLIGSAIAFVGGLWQVAIALRHIVKAGSGAGPQRSPSP